jgi:hypothetical protein
MPEGRRSRSWICDSQQPGNLPAFRAQPFDCLANINERRFDAGGKSHPRLSQRNAPRGAREQRDAEPVLYAAHGVTDCRRAHAELSRRGREGPVPSNTNNDGQVAEEISLHSCTVSYIVCDLTRLIEPDLRIHLRARPRLVDPSVQIDRCGRNSRPGGFRHQSRWRRSGRLVEDQPPKSRFAATQACGVMS